MTEEEIINLSNELQKITFHHIVNKLIDKGEQDTSDLINFVLSAHLNSMSICMIRVADSCMPPNPKMKEYVNKFIEETTNFVLDKIPKEPQ